MTLGRDLGMRGLARASALMLCIAGACAGLLGGCATQSTTTTSPTGASASRDIATASDETEAQRRARIRLELASAYYAQGQMTTALDEVKLALSTDPNNASAYNLRGLIYDALGDERVAEESFLRATSIDPRDNDVKQNYGWFLCQHKRYAEADRVFTESAKDPQNRFASRTLLAQGVCQRAAGKMVEAESTLKQSYELDASNPATGMNLADVLYRRGDYDRARFYVRRVNSVPEQVNAESLWLAVRVENKLGNRQSVSEFGTQLRQRFPSSREAVAYERRQFDE